MKKIFILSFIYAINIYGMESDKVKKDKDIQATKGLLKLQTALLLLQNIDTLTSQYERKCIICAETKELSWPL